MTTTNLASLVKCACDRCHCEISVENAIKKNEQYYCCEACANGHSEDQSCKMSDCHCG
ncbi:MAG: metallothionein [Waterburya sp.]